MIISIIATERELKKIKELFPDASMTISVANTKFSSDRRIHERKFARHDLIKNVLGARTLNSGTLFNLLRRRGYSVGYKSFQRDMQMLLSYGDVTSERNYLGVHGSTVIWSLVDDKKQN